MLREATGYPPVLCSFLQTVLGLIEPHIIHSHQSPSKKKLFARMTSLDQASMSLKALTESFGWERNQQVIQHDVQELNRVLFDALEQVWPCLLLCRPTRLPHKK